MISYIKFNRLIEGQEFDLTAKNIDNINDVVEKLYQQSKAKDWHSGDIDETYFLATKIALIHSEISEALEGLRKGLMDTHLPHRKMVEVELADAVIRIFDLAGRMGLDLGNAIAEKHTYNRTRADHKIENRMKDGGKKF